jgi:hypothetical protein
MKEALPPSLFPSPDGEQSDYANDIQDKYHHRVDAKVKELAFGAEDEAVDIDSCRERSQASEVDVGVFGLWEDGLS